jgi:hypothetical protein
VQQPVWLLNLFNVQILIIEVVNFLGACSASQQVGLQGCSNINMCQPVSSFCVLPAHACPADPVGAAAAAAAAFELVTNNMCCCHHVLHMQFAPGSVSYLYTICPLMLLLLRAAYAGGPWFCVLPPPALPDDPAAAATAAAAACYQLVADDVCCIAPCVPWLQVAPGSVCCLQMPCLMTPLLLSLQPTLLPAWGTGGRSWCS